MLVDLLALLIVICILLFIVERLIPPLELMPMNLVRFIIGIIALVWLLNILGVVNVFPRFR